MNKLTTSTAMPARALKTEPLASLLESFERLCLAAGVETLGLDDGGRCASRLRPTPRAEQATNGPSLGQDERQDRIPRRQGGDRASTASWL